MESDAKRLPLANSHVLFNADGGIALMNHAGVKLAARLLLWGHGGLRCAAGQGQDRGDGDDLVHDDLLKLRQGWIT